MRLWSRFFLFFFSFFLFILLLLLLLPSLPPFSFLFLTYRCPLAPTNLSKGLPFLRGVASAFSSRIHYRGRVRLDFYRRVVGRNDEERVLPLSSSLSSLVSYSRSRSFSYMFSRSLSTSRLTSEARFHQGQCPGVTGTSSRHKMHLIHLRNSRAT